MNCINKKIICASRIIYKNGKLFKKNLESDSNTMYQIASCSKFITSLVIAKLYELEKLDYDTDINEYLKKWECPVDGITLRYLLTHTSGSSDFNGYLGMEPQFLCKQNLDTNIKIIEGESYSKPFNVTENIGKKFMYSGAGYQVIQQVIEEITGKRLYQLMKQYLFRPLNMEHSTGKLLYDGKHNYPLANTYGLYRMYPETAAAGVWMSCNDLYTLIMDIMNGYNDGNSKILNQETIKMITKGNHPEWQKVYHNYGLGMFIEETKNGRLFAHNGSNCGYKMNFHCIPKKKYINILLINHNPKYHKGIYKETDKLLNII